VADTRWTNKSTRGNHASYRPVRGNGDNRWISPADLPTAHPPFPRLPEHRRRRVHDGEGGHELGRLLEEAAGVRKDATAVRLPRRQHGRRFRPDDVAWVNRQPVEADFRERPDVFFSGRAVGGVSVAVGEVVSEE